MVCYQTCLDLGLNLKMQFVSYVYVPKVKYQTEKNNRFLGICSNRLMIKDNEVKDRKRSNGR